MTTQVIAFIIAIIAIVILGTVAIYNGLIELKNQVKNAYAQIEVQLKRRHDLIPNLIETVKGYMHHEAETLEKVTQARLSAINMSNDAGAQAKNESALSGALKNLFAVSENYPDLKANQNFLALQEELASTENKISFARQYYNDSVMQYDTKKEIFPHNIIAGMFNFPSYTAFVITDAAERENVQVKFD